MAHSQHKWVVTTYQRTGGVGRLAFREQHASWREGTHTVVVTVMSTQIGVRHKLPDQLVGFDCFTSGSRVLGTPNPFDVGVVGYSRDFWTPGRELGVGYDRLYEILPEGFREATQQVRTRGGGGDEHREEGPLFVAEARSRFLHTFL